MRFGSGPWQVFTEQDAFDLDLAGGHTSSNPAPSVPSSALKHDKGAVSLKAWQMKSTDVTFISRGCHQHWPFCWTQCCSVALVQELSRAALWILPSTARLRVLLPPAGCVS